MADVFVPRRDQPVALGVYLRERGWLAVGDEVVHRPAAADCRAVVSGVSLDVI